MDKNHERMDKNEAFFGGKKFSKSSSGFYVTFLLYENFDSNYLLLCLFINLFLPNSFYIEFSITKSYNQVGLCFNTI